MINIIDLCVIEGQLLFTSSVLALEVPIVYEQYRVIPNQYSQVRVNRLYTITLDQDIH